MVDIRHAVEDEEAGTRAVGGRGLRADLLSRVPVDEVVDVDVDVNVEDSRASDAAVADCDVAEAVVGSFRPAVAVVEEGSTSAVDGMYPPCSDAWDHLHIHVAEVAVVLVKVIAFVRLAEPCNAAAAVAVVAGDGGSHLQTQRGDLHRGRQHRRPHPHDDQHHCYREKEGVTVSHAALCPWSSPADVSVEIGRAHV